MTALLRYDASGVPQILHNEPAFLDAQDDVLVVFGECDEVAGFPVADGEFHGAEWLSGLGFELVAVQHHRRVVRLSSCRRGTLRAWTQHPVPSAPLAISPTYCVGTIPLAEFMFRCRKER